MLKASVKKRDEIKLMREGGKILAEIVRKMAEETKPDISTMYLEEVATKYLKSMGVVSPFKGYDGYKFNSCLSVNNVVVHGEPSTKVILKEGDLLKIDLGVNFHGMITDHAITVIVGNKTTPLFLPFILFLYFVVLGCNIIYILLISLYLFSLLYIPKL